jgi:hypothetical protein
MSLFVLGAKPDLSGYVPYIGATEGLDLGSNFLKVSDIRDASGATYLLTSSGDISLGLSGTLFLEPGVETIASTPFTVNADFFAGLSTLSSDGGYLSLNLNPGGCAAFSVYSFDVTDEFGGNSIFYMNPEEGTFLGQGGTSISFNASTFSINVGGVEVMASNGSDTYFDGNVDFNSTIYIGGITKIKPVYANSIGQIVSSSPIAQVNLTAQGAAKTTTTLYAVPSTAAGKFRIHALAEITRAATSSCEIGGTAGLVITYTSAVDSVVRSITVPNMRSTTNSTATAVTGSIIINAKASTNIQYAYDYTSSGATTMQYDLSIVTEPC